MSVIFFKWMKHLEKLHMSGTIEIYDAFVTEAPLLLYADIKSQYCHKEQKTMLVFQFSPKQFNHAIWDKLQNVKLRKGLCRQ